MKREDRRYLIALLVLGLLSVGITKTALGGSNTAYMPAYPSIDAVNSAWCGYFAEGWLAKGRCDGGTPRPWNDGVIRGPGADDDAAVSDRVVERDEPKAGKPKDRDRKRDRRRDRKRDKKDRQQRCK